MDILTPKILSYSLFPAAGTGKGDGPKFKSINAAVKTGTMQQLADDSYTTSFTCKTFRGNTRNNANFETASAIFLDYDHNVDYLGICEELGDLNISYILLFSTSHTWEKQKFHIILPTETEITDGDVYKATWQYAFSMLTPGDSSVGSLDRIFFSSNPAYRQDQIVHDIGKYLKLQEPAPKLIVKRTAYVAHTSYETTTGYEFYCRNIKHLGGNKWNECLNGAVRDMAKLGMGKEEIAELLEDVLGEPFNRAARSEIERNYNKYYRQPKPKGAKMANKGPDTQEKFKVLESVLAERYRVLQIGKERVDLLHIEPNGEASSVSDSALATVAGQELRKSFDRVFDAKDCEALAKTWRSQTDLVTGMPDYVKFLSQSGITFKKLDFDPIPGNAPYWSEMMTRTSNAKALQAFIYSIFEPLSDRTQYLWVYGDGGNGKSTIVELLSKMLGDAYSTEDASRAQSAFFTAGFFKKRLVVFPDTNTETFVRTGTLKSLTGDSQIRIEKKGKDSFTAPINCKIMMNSNNLPSIGNSEADLRRIIFSEIIALPRELRDVTIGNRLWAERAAILYLCKQAYEQTVVEHGPIACDTVEMEDLASTDNDKFEVLFDEFFKMDANGFVSSKDVEKMCASLCQKRGIRITQLRKYIVKTKGAVGTKGPGNRGQQEYGYKGISLC